ncbi:MAG: TonB-dependent receptor [Gemmatimonadetes bacterium]|nr:TonB-dependent receptor [Gemmatimonadota bacterium]
MRLSSYVAVAAASLVVVVLPAPTSGQNAPDDTTTVYVLDPITVRGPMDNLVGQVSTASVGYVGARDLRLRPLSREGELLETVPGMILTQHSGGGKSNQMFVRGFNLDHGTDFSTKLDGMPINLPTHAHGHGYTDLNFLVPELVDHIEYSLGNYYAEIGDFGSAGGAEFRLRRSLDAPLFEVGWGANSHRRVLAAASTSGAVGTLLAGGELHNYDGPWESPERLRKRSGMLRYTREGRTSSFSLLALAYRNEWNSTDQIPMRAVQSGSIGRFGQVDPTLGGEGARYSLSAAWDRSTATSNQKVDVYVARYSLDLFSNFTYFLGDPTDGDQIRQQDRGRWIMGANAAHLQPLDLFGREHRLTVGTQMRGDFAGIALSRTSRRQLLTDVRADDVTQLSVGGYAELVSTWSRRFRSTLGLRGDAYRFHVSSQRVENVGTTSDHIVSPKVSLTFGPWAGTEVYVSGGIGFHSNDARGTVTTVDPNTGGPVDPVDPLVPSQGAEIGLRSEPLRGLQATGALWMIELASELLFVGDAGTTEPSDRSRRVGVTMTSFYRITEEWSADLDLSLARARLLGVAPDQDRIPGALENVVAAGFGYEPTGNGVFGSMRVRRFGGYPLIENGTVRAQTNSLVNASVGYRWGEARLTVSVLNLLDEDHSDVQYYYASRLPGEPAGGVDDVHFHPAEPRQLRVGVSWGL